MKLREARRLAGKTQQQLAAAVGVEQQTISDYEKGRRYPTVVRARQIERLLGREPGEIDWPGTETSADDEPTASGQ